MENLTGIAIYPMIKRIERVNLNAEEGGAWNVACRFLQCEVPEQIEMSGNLLNYLPVSTKDVVLFNRDVIFSDKPFGWFMLPSWDKPIAGNGLIFQYDVNNRTLLDSSLTGDNLLIFRNRLSMGIYYPSLPADMFYNSSNSIDANSASTTKMESDIWEEILKRLDNMDQRIEGLEDWSRDEDLRYNTVCDQIWDISKQIGINTNQIPDTSGLC